MLMAPLHELAQVGLDDCELAILGLLEVAEAVAPRVTLPPCVLPVADTVSVMLESAGAVKATTQ